MVTTQRTPLDEFLSLPDDGRHHELVRGEILYMPPPKGEHGRLELVLGSAIDRFLENRARSLDWKDADGRSRREWLTGWAGVGEVGVALRLPDDTEQIRGLDVAYFTAEQVARFGEQLRTAYAPEMPAFVAEVISPSETAEYIDQKVADFRAGGARLIWLVYPRTRSVTVVMPDGTARTLGNDAVLDGGDVLPGFHLNLVDLFS